MNQQSIEDLYARWQQNPDAAETTALCEALRGGRRPDLVEIVGSHASRQLDLGVLAGDVQLVDARGSRQRVGDVQRARFIEREPLRATEWRVDDADGPIGRDAVDLVPARQRRVARGELR